MHYSICYHPAGREKSYKTPASAIFFFDFFQEAQDKLLELDRLSNELEAFVEKTKNATIEETEVKVNFVTLIIFFIDLM